MLVYAPLSRKSSPFHANTLIGHSVDQVVMHISALSSASVQVSAWLQGPVAQVQSGVLPAGAAAAS